MFVSSGVLCLLSHGPPQQALMPRLPSGHRRHLRERRRQADPVDISDRAEFYAPVKVSSESLSRRRFITAGDFVFALFCKNSKRPTLCGNRTHTQSHNEGAAVTSARRPHPTGTQDPIRGSPYRHLEVDVEELANRRGGSHGRRSGRNSQCVRSAGATRGQAEGNRRRARRRRGVGEAASL